MTSSPTLWLGFPRKRSGEGPSLSTTEPNCDQLPVPHVKTNTNRNLSRTTEWAPMLGNALWLSLGAPQSSSNSREDAALRAEGRNCCFKELGSHNVLGFAFACFSKRTYMKICRAKTPGPKSQDCKLKGTSFFSYFHPSKNFSTSSLHLRSTCKALLSAADPGVPSKKILEINMPLPNPLALIK